MTSMRTGSSQDNFCGKMRRNPSNIHKLSYDVVCHLALLGSKGLIV